MSCAQLSARDASSPWVWRDRERSCRWWYFLPFASDLVDWQSFTRWRICPSLFQWMLCCALLRSRHRTGLLPQAMKNLLYLSSRSLTRRNYMLDLIIIVVTIVTFIAF